MFIFRKYFSAAEKEVWTALSKVSVCSYRKKLLFCIFKVFKITYCDFCVESEENQYQRVCREFVNSVKQHFPELSRKLKVHLILHLTDNMMDFGPTSSFNTERSAVFKLFISHTHYNFLSLRSCESFNSLMRSRNIFANRLAPSRDIARGFEVLGTLRSLCASSDTRYSTNSDCHGLLVYYSVGSGLRCLYSSQPVQSYLNGIPPKELFRNKRIYKHGELRKVIPYALHVSFT